MKRFGLWLLAFLVGVLLCGCRAGLPADANMPEPEQDTELLVLQTTAASATAAPDTDTSMSTPALAETAETPAPAETAETPAPDGNGTIYFTIVLHLEGWDDGENEGSFRRHASQLREYADLFESYGASMTLESKEIIEGCVNWDDNVLFEMQTRGHAVGIHADAGGNDSASIRAISETLSGMKENLALLGIDAVFASGVASKANWVKACEDAGIDTVSCMVAYGLWALNPALRPEGFEPYTSPGDGHEPYPFAVEERVSPWLAADGSNWIVPDPNGRVLIIPSGLSLNNAYEEQNGERALKSDFTIEDIQTWEEILPVVLAASDSGRVNTFYAVWSFGKAVDMTLLKEWLHLIDGYVRQGRIVWSTIPEMAARYRSSIGG